MDVVSLIQVVRQVDDDHTGLAFQLIAEDFGGVHVQGPRDTVFCDKYPYAIVPAAAMTPKISWAA